MPGKSREPPLSSCRRRVVRTALTDPVGNVHALAPKSGPGSGRKSRKSRPPKAPKALQGPQFGGPKVSIVMAAFNAADHIGPSIESVRAQSWPNWELIIVDDGSTDQTVAAINAYARQDSRIIVHPLGMNVGVSRSRNAALGLATGEWLTILDSDDTYHPDRLRTLLASCIGGGLDLVADNIELYDEVADAVLSHAFTFDGDACLLTRELLAANDGPPRIASLGHLKPFVRRSLIEDAGVRYPTDIKVGEDFHFLFCLLGLTKQATLLKFAGYRYTLPYSVEAGVRAKGTRTTYDKSSLDYLAASNRALLQQVDSVSARNVTLHNRLEKRGKALRDEYGWRDIRQFLRSGRLFAALRQCAHLDISFVRDQLVAIVLRRLGRIDTPLRDAIRVGAPAQADSMALPPMVRACVLEIAA